MSVTNEDALNFAEKITRRNEGLVLHPYRDTSPRKLLTIGVGRNLEDKGITLDEAMLMQKNDINAACELLAKNIPWYADLSPLRQAVFIDMVFNMDNKFFTFEKMLGYAKSGDWPNAATEILASAWLGEVGDRARRAAKMLETNLYVSD